MGSRHGILEMSSVPPTERVAIVTGAAHGIGKAFSLELVRRGYRVVALDIDGEALARTAADDGLPEERFLPQVADVADEDAVRKAVGVVLARMGRIDALVNNAGVIFDVREPIETLSLETWNHSLAVSATGTFLMCRACVPSMREARHGRIVNVSSAMVGSGAPGRVHYVSAKAALIGLTRALAREVGRERITVNALCPGLVDSGPRARAFVDKDLFELEERRRCIPSRMFPKDLVGALLFLLSEEAGFLTGQVVTVDGGSVMG
jgi:3-oxoacyl-[acyl-carrier protein] reductase